jgi:hypothetical protein
VTNRRVEIDGHMAIDDGIVCDNSAGIDDGAAIEMDARVHVSGWMNGINVAETHGRELKVDSFFEAARREGQYVPQLGMMIGRKPGQAPEHLRSADLSTKL